MTLFFARKLLTGGKVRQKYEWNEARIFILLLAKYFDGEKSRKTKITAMSEKKERDGNNLKKNNSNFIVHGKSNFTFSVASASIHRSNFSHIPGSPSLRHSCTKYN